MRRVASLVLVALICCLAPREGTAAAVRLAVCPLQIYSGEDLAYLREGLLDMFISRLQVEDRVVALDKSRVRETLGSLDAANASLTERRGFMSRVEADVLVYGSVTKLGESLSVDVRLLEASAAAPVVFSAQAQNLDGLMPEIEGLLEQVRQRLTGDRPPPPPPASPRSPAPTSGSAAGFDPSLQLEVPFQARGLGVGDVDGAGGAEIVLADSNGVFVYRLTDGALQLAAEYRGKSYEDVIHLDVGDVNGNGLAEIFVTSVRDGPRSFVLEWSEGELRPTETDLRYFLRIFQGADGTPRLIGQEASGDSWPFAGRSYPLAHREGRYVAGEALPGSFPLYYTLTVDLDGDGPEETVILDGEGRLVAVNVAGGQLWRGGAGYGGSCVNYEYLPVGKEDVTQYLEIPVRMLAAAGGVGKGREVVVARNRGTGLGNFLRKKKLYGAGELVGLEWDGTALRRTWSYPDLNGCVVDMQFADVTGDGQRDLVAVTTDGGEVLLSGPGSGSTVHLFKPGSR
ncbi:MAG: FG-GAP-like repeat-containing protein [Deferrisomatales bacterium]|nr:FG-GAP-like repeat-containing protein [Deferrisomatales bacterium]